MPDFLDTKLNLRAPTFETLDLSAAELFALFEHPLTWRYLSLVIVILILADPTRVAHEFGVPLYCTIWLAAFLLYLAFQAALLTALGAVRKFAPRPAVYWPIVSLCAFFPTLLLVETAMALAISDPQRAPLSDRVVYLATMLILFEIIFLRFVMPRVRTEAAPDSPHETHRATSRRPGRLLHIAGQPVALEKVKLIEARQHHVHVRLCDGTLTERARLSDIVAQTRPEDGIQPHRSWWVSRRAVRRLGKRSGREVLQLSDDSQVPVARGRVEDVRDWIETYLDDIA